MSTAILSLGSINVKITEDGLYCLNDLHKGSGAHVKHRPADWIKLHSTQALINEIEKEGYPSIKKSAGRNGGTFVCREMVYAYAMWISPTFSLKVIRAFDALAAGDVGSALAIANNAPTMKTISEEVEKIKQDDTLTVGQKHDKILLLSKKYEELASDCGKGLGMTRSVKSALKKAANEQLNKAQLCFKFLFD